MPLCDPESIRGIGFAVACPAVFGLLRHCAILFNANAAVGLESDLLIHLWVAHKHSLENQHLKFGHGTSTAQLETPHQKTQTHAARGCL
jgi:hypothetical protein